MNNSIEIESEQQMNSILESIDGEKSAIIDFYADWCGPCRNLMPTLEKIANENENIIVMKVNVDRNSDIARKQDFMVRSIPTLFFYRDGSIQSKLMGIQSEETLINQAKG